jgi:hypothetical protein
MTLVVLPRVLRIALMYPVLVALSEAQLYQERVARLLILTCGMTQVRKHLQWQLTWQPEHTPQR